MADAIHMARKMGLRRGLQSDAGGGVFGPAYGSVPAFGGDAAAAAALTDCGAAVDIGCSNNFSPGSAVIRTYAARPDRL
jgi:hypothetical protein